MIEYYLLGGSAAFLTYMLLRRFLNRPSKTYAETYDKIIHSKEYKVKGQFDE